MNDWKPIDTMPEGVLCMTRIDDADGIRNEQKLTKLSRIPGETRPMYFAGDMYVYYTPTHWRPL